VIESFSQSGAGVVPEGVHYSTNAPTSVITDVFSQPTDSHGGLNADAYPDPFWNNTFLAPVGSLKTC
jgi:hypothetical protein